MKKLVKVLLVLLLASVLAISCAMPAFADLVWIPEDKFYLAHSRECSKVNRGYELAGEGGNVELWSAPDGTVIKELSNGEIRFVGYSWSDGTVEWGLIESEDGWVRLEDMLLLYSNDDFFKDHAEEIEEIDTAFPIEAKEIRLFPYPNSPEVNTRVLDWGVANDIPFNASYTDEAGLKWCYISLWYNARNEWVCIDEPMIEGTTERQYVLTPDQEARAAAKGGQTTLILAAVLVVAVVIVTIVLIRKIPKRK